MKRFVIILFLMLFISGNSAYARPHHHHCGHYYHSSCSHCYNRPIYPIWKSVSTSEVPIKNCKKHSLECETTIIDYSDNTRRTLKNYTLFDENGNIIIDNCSYIEHIVYKNKCYFIVRYYDGKVKYKIIQGNNQSDDLTTYSKLTYLKENRLLATKNNYRGIIDLSGNEIIPIQYTSLQELGKGVYKAKINGAYGVLSVDGKVLVPCECDKIKKLGTYYQIKMDNKWGIMDLNGKILAPIKYKDVKLKKNKLYVKEFGCKWCELN